MLKKESQIKRLKCSDKKPLNKEIKIVLKNFKNIKVKIRKKKRKVKWKVKTTFVFFVVINM